MNIECDIKVSIIVPVYNVPEKALRKCIESTISQTLHEIEIILVDDESKDNSGVICDEYSKVDSRIKVIHKKNGGLSAARNTGYRFAMGKWITFIDSDDWIEEKTCEDIYLYGEEHNADIVIFGTVQEFEHYKNLFKYHYQDGQMFVGEECKDLQCEILNFSGNIATAWAKLIKKDFLDRNAIEHNEELRQGSEGIEFNIRLFEKVGRVYFTDKVYYHYMYNLNSISAKHDEKNHYYVIRCFEEIRNQIMWSNNRESLEKLFYKRILYIVVAAAISGYFSPQNTQKFRDKKESFEKYLECQIVSDSLQNEDTNWLDKKRRLIVFLIKNRCFKMISIISLLRYLQKHL